MTSRTKTKAAPAIDPLTQALCMIEWLRAEVATLREEIAVGITTRSVTVVDAEGVPRVEITSGHRRGNVEVFGDDDVSASLWTEGKANEGMGCSAGVTVKSGDSMEAEWTQRATRLDNGDYVIIGSTSSKVGIGR